MFRLDDLTRQLPYRARRASSYDRSGGNDDNMPVAPGETAVVFDVEAAGEIRHIWLAFYNDEPFFLRTTLLRMYWDGEETPSVECPLGDFFCLGHSRSYTHVNAAFSVTVNDQTRQGEGVALNCWLPMPFRKSARIELVSGQDTPFRAYYYIDWREYDHAPEGEIYTLHASWRRENPTAVPPKEGDALYDEMLAGCNLTDRYNYLLLYAEGRGNYLGMNLSMDNLEGEWWGEGDDMIFIDRKDNSRECGGQWPPDLHGTGSEDYLCHAHGMQRHQGMFAGEAWCEDNNFLRAHNCNGKVCVYRFHIADPVPFRENIRVSMEHGHANDRADDWASTVYWYQAEPHSPLSYEPMPPVEARMPRPPKTGRMLATYM